MLEIKLQVERPLFYNDSSNFGVYACISDSCEVKKNSWNNFVINGVMPRLDVGMEYTAQLEEKNHKKYGLSYEVKLIHQEKPTSIEDQRVFFETLISKGHVDTIFRAYPDQDIIQLMQEDKIDINKLKGIGKTTYEKIKHKVLTNIEIQEALVKLHGYGVTYKMIMKMLEHFKTPAILVQEVENNPYVLTDVGGIGFKKCDTYALKMGVEKENKNRVHSGIRYLIEEDQNSGHCYMLKGDLVKKAVDLLEIEEELITKELEGDIKGLKIIDDKVTLTKTYTTELYIAERLLELQSKSKPLDFDVDEFLDRKQKEYGIGLTDQQKGFFYNFRDNHVCFLIGYAGVGKSFIQKLLLDMVEEIDLSYKCLSPTGKAAKVLQGYTGREAFTIHFAAGIYNNDQNAQNDIFSDELNIDESSMCDIYTVAKLLSKIKKEDCRLVFIGDDFQLPSVNIGAFLYDCINSGRFPVTKLTQVFRQKDGGILDIATRIREGEEFVKYGFRGKIEFGKDLIFHSVEQKYMKDGYLHYYKELLKKYSPEDIVILTPTKKGQLGTWEINKEIQAIVNPPEQGKREKEYGDKVYRVGDQVINIKNVYEYYIDDEGREKKKLKIPNGELGVIVDIIPDATTIKIKYDSGIEELGFDDLDKILHSYCLTIHKMQGSSSKAVIMLFDKAHTFQLNANLLYTAPTRAEKDAVILCQAEVVNNAMRKIVSQERRTFLGDILKGMK